MPSPQLISFGQLFMRASTGILMFSFHGWGKFKAVSAYYLSGAEWKFIEGVGSLGFPYPVFFATLAAFSESIAALLLALGLATRPAAGFLAVTMGVAVYRHATTDMKIELALLYFVISLYFLVSGPNRYALDRWLWSRKKK